MTGRLGQWNFAFGRAWKPSAAHFVRRTHDGWMFPYDVFGVRLIGSIGFIATKYVEPVR